MQDNYEAPLTGDIKVDVQTAQVVSDFLLMILKMDDAPINRDQMEAFNKFRETTKAGPVAEVLTGRNRVSTLADGIVIGNGPKMLIDRHLSIKFLRSMLSGEQDIELISSFKVALLDAIAKKGPKKNTGSNGKFCQGVFGYANPHEARDYLCGDAATIVVSRGKTQAAYMPTYFSETPNHFLNPDKIWNGAKDHVKTKFTEEEMKNQ